MIEMLCVAITELEKRIHDLERPNDMTKEIKISCDNCNEDITKSEGAPRHRLHLTEERIPITGGIVFSVNILPQLNGEKHFCGLGCLKKWIEKPKDE